MEKQVKKELSPEVKSTQPISIIQAAISSGADLDKLEKLIELQERWEANEARKAYYVAMTAFKQNPPKIDKDKKINYSTSKGNVGYSHASLYNVVEKITIELSKHGLSASWRTAQTDKLITVTCKISHVLGHSEENSISAEADQSGAKNSIQAIGSTITYLERYAILALTGLATHDQDTDGRVEEEKVDENKLNIITELIKKTNVNLPSFLTYMGVDAVENIAAKDFLKAKVALEAKTKDVK